MPSMNSRLGGDHLGIVHRVHGPQRVLVRQHRREEGHQRGEDEDRQPDHRLPVAAEGEPELAQCPPATRPRHRARTGERGLRRDRLGGGGFQGHAVRTRGSR